MSEIKELESKYRPLADFLKKAPSHQREIPLSLEQIEIIIRARLPPSAYQYPAWWYGQDRPHVRAWSQVGWEVETHLSKGWVLFKRKRI